MELATLAGIDEEVIAVIAVGGGLVVAVVAIVFGTLGSIIKSRHREDSRREIAAYVAEGSISPEDAERLLRAERPKWERG